jgi:hypothetical protein
MCPPSRTPCHSLRLLGHVRTVRGRDTAAAETGLARLSALSLDTGDGRVVSALIHDPDPVRLVAAVGVAVIEAARFTLRPICQIAEADTAEHVPPGGSVARP